MIEMTGLAKMRSWESNVASWSMGEFYAFYIYKWIETRDPFPACILRIAKWGIAVRQQRGMIRVYKGLSWPFAFLMNHWWDDHYPVVASKKSHEFP